MKKDYVVLTLKCVWTNKKCRHRINGLTLDDLDREPLLWEFIAQLESKYGVLDGGGFENKEGVWQFGWESDGIEYNNVPVVFGKIIEKINELFKGKIK